MAGITLAQVAALETDKLKKGIITNIIRDAQVMNFIPFENVSSLKVRALVWTKLPGGGEWRQLNAGYTSEETGAVGEVWESLYGFGGEITFDTVLSRVTGWIEKPSAMQLKMKLKSLAFGWKDALVNGDHAVDPDQFEGLKKRVSNMPSRQTVYFAASDAAPLDPTASAANARAFLDKLDELWYKCNAGQVNLLLGNEDMQWGIGRVCRYLQTQGNFLSTTKDVIGRDILTWKNVPLIDMGYKRDQSTEIITNTEVAGDSGEDSTSLYACSLNKDDGVYGIQLDSMKAYDPLNGGEMESKPAKMMRIDWWNGIASFGNHGITRGRNIAAPSSWT